jgi:hypothetical protein
MNAVPEHGETCSPPTYANTKYLYINSGGPSRSARNCFAFHVRSLRHAPRPATFIKTRCPSAVRTIISNSVLLLYTYIMQLTTTAWPREPRFTLTLLLILEFLCLTTLLGLFGYANPDTYRSELLRDGLASGFEEPTFTTPLVWQPMYASISPSNH